MATMRTCISCGDPIPDDKRKDAKYCEKPACRGLQYRKRQAEARAAEGNPHRHAGSTVLTCTCGRRYKLQIVALDEPESRTEPASAPPNAPMEAITETVLPTAQRAHAVNTRPATEPAASETIAQTVSLTALDAQTTPAGRALEAKVAAAVTQSDRLTDQQPDEPSAPPQSTGLDDTRALTKTDRTDTSATALVTLELNFTRGTERRMSFNKAAHHQRDGRWILHPQARATFSLSEANRYCLGGRPGAWQRYYGGRSPIEYGYEPDLVVMVWDHDARRGRVANANLLRQILGDDWKAKLRAEVGER